MLQDHRDREMIPIDSAADLLARMYRSRLEKNPVLVLLHWQRQVDGRATIDFQDDEWVLLVPRQEPWRPSL